MNSVEDGKSSLISSIEADARAEAGAVIDEAEKQAGERRLFGGKQVESIIKDANEKAASQSDVIKKKTLVDIDVEIKRRYMQMRDSLINEIVAGVEKELSAMVASPEYRETLLGWIVEAAIGLGAEAAEVNVSKEERHFIDRQFLSEAEKRIAAMNEAKIKLRLSEDPPLRLQGPVLTAVDGRTAYNNQVKTRILRSQREIRKRIYEKLFIEDREVQQ